MKAIRVTEKSESSDDLKFELAEVETPKIKDGECLVEIHASGINPSDVKALLGKMPNLTWPRTPGRDYAGVVVEGPSELIGKEVWGTGGDLGMGRNGAHAEFNVVDAAGIREKPKNLSMAEAGSIGVSWTCAWLGMVPGAHVASGETVAVLGANGKVGESAIQIATAAGASVIAVERSRDEYYGHATGPVDVVNLEKEPDLQKAIMDRTAGKGADIIMNTVGSPYFDVACNSMAKQGRQIIVTTIVEDNTINLRTFYRGNYRMIGVSNMDHDNILSGELLEDMKSGFESGAYKPYPIKDENVYSLENAGEAYKIVLKGLSRDRIVINPKA
ncbi:MAG: zinc-binding alcohol dehydrogenase family protein [Rhodospirillaceae bacterium]|nr:zinc-binding alcohol dehydrogenase family protein [Rhodospirillaceae bacterium]